VERAFLLLPSPDSPSLAPHVARARDGSPADGTSISRTVIERVVAGRLAVLSVDEGAMPATGERPGPAASGKRWFMAVPLWSGGRAIGVLYADSPEAVPLTAADLDLLHGLALCAAAAIEQARDTDRLLLDAARVEGRPSPADAPTPRQGLAAPAGSAQQEPVQNT
jgi:GAF domain-containing protein